MNRKVSPKRMLCAAFAILIVIGQLAPTYAQAESRVIASYNRNSPRQTAAPQQMKVDRQVNLASHQQPAALNVAKSEDSSRMLAPRTKKPDTLGATDPGGKRSKSPKFALPRIESFTTAGGGLAIVVGLFLVCMWLLRTSGAKPTAALPSDAVSMLGRIPLAPRSFAHLLQFGHKLVLVAITPEGVSTIAEITDPMEVQRLLGLCMQNNKHSTSAEFRDVLKHLTKEPAKGFLGNEVSSAYATQGR